MPLDLSRMSIWYRAEVGDDGFNAKDFLDREYAGERALFDINGRTQRFSAAIGSTWYYEQDTMTIDDLAPKNVLHFDENNNLTLNGEPCPTNPAKTDPATTDDAKNRVLFKALPPIPDFEDSKVVVPNVSEVCADKDLKSLTGARIDEIPFDYMFADADEAEVTTTQDDDHDSLDPAEMVDDEGDVVPDDVGPSTPPQTDYHRPAQAQAVNQVLDLGNIDTSAIHAQDFLSAGIPTTTTDLIENHILALGTNLAAPLIVDEEHEAEKAQATDIFFNGPVEESPGPYHAPLLQGESGYGDVREGAEEFPELWAHNGPDLETATFEDADAIAPTVIDKIPEAIDASLPAEPAEDAKTKPRNVLFGLAGRAKARKEKQAAALADGHAIDNTPGVIDLTVDEHETKGSSIAKKRRARSSFSTKPTLGDAKYDDEIRDIFTKKARVVSDDDWSEVFSDRRPSTYSLITQPDDGDTTPVDALGDAARLSQICEVKGFNGQFHGLKTPEQAERAKKLNAHKVPVYMGQAHHLNNLILHKDLHACPTFETTEYTPASAHPDSDIGRCISYANQRSDEAAGMTRTSAEEALRKEVHLECASARLHGAVVGFYRYYQGHLTVEEYHERKMCICWQICECSKLCTRFPDMICPCGDKIETNCR